MGVVIRPAAFTGTGTISSAPLAGDRPASDEAWDVWRPSMPATGGRQAGTEARHADDAFLTPRARTGRPNRPDRRLLAIVIALALVTWIFALAGAAFAIRAVLVLCFATLAGRGRRVGVPVIASPIVGAAPKIS